MRTNLNFPPIDSTTPPPFAPTIPTIPPLSTCISSLYRIKLLVHREVSYVDQVYMLCFWCSVLHHFVVQLCALLVVYISPICCSRCLESLMKADLVLSELFFFVLLICFVHETAGHMFSLLINKHNSRHKITFIQYSPCFISPLNYSID